IGLRMYGSAGIEMIGVITGQLGGYISNLKTWDLAAGRMLAEELGLVVKSIDGSSINVLSSNLVLVATRQVSRDIRQIINYLSWLCPRCLSFFMKLAIDRPLLFDLKMI